MSGITTLEAVLGALEAVLGAALPGAEVLRNADRPERVPAGGLAILNDGQQVGAEAMFSPLSYQITHRAELVLAAGAEAGRAAMLRQVADAIAADRTLGGLVMWAEPQAPNFDLGEWEGAAAARAAELELEVWFLAADMVA